MMGLSSRFVGRRRRSLAACLTAWSTVACMFFGLVTPQVAAASGGSGLTAPVLRSEPVTTPGMQNNVAWTMPQVVHHYELQCATDQFFGPRKQVGRVKVKYPKHNYAFTGLTPGRTYYYRVRAVKNNDKSPWSNTVISVQDDPAARMPIAVPGKGYFGIVGSPMTLDGSLSRDPDGTIVTYEWGIDRDDDHHWCGDEYDPSDIQWVYSSANPRQVHTFTSPGCYEIYLRVTDDDGNTDIGKTYALVLGDFIRPVAILSMPTTATAGEAVTLDASSSFDAWGEIVSYSWDFESDDRYDLVTTEPIIQWTWAVPGEWDVRLDVRDGAGNVGRTTGTIAITPITDVPPEIPQNFTAVDRPADDGGAVDLAWTANTEPDVAGYRVYRAPAADGPYQQIADVGESTVYTDTGLTDGTSYWYVATAYDDAGNESLFSVNVEAVSADNTAPSTPTGLTLTDVPADEGVALVAAWNPSPEPDVSGYTLVVAGPIGAPALYELPADTTSHTVTGLSADSVYRFSISAHDEVPNNSALSLEVPATPADNLAPGRPSGLAAFVPDSGEYIELSWAPSSAADVGGYSILRAASEDGPYVEIGTSDSTTYTFTDFDVELGSTYHYAVSAHDTHGNASDPSDSITAFPLDHLPPAPPAAPNVTDVSPDQGGAVTVSWPANTEADLAGYKVAYYDGFGTLIAVHDVGGATTDSMSGITTPELAVEVIAYDDHDNDSAPSARVAGTAADELAPAVPSVTAVDHASDNGGAVDVSWSAGAEADLDHYTVYRAEAAEGPWSVAVADTDLTSWTDTGAALGVTYHYAVTAHDTHGNESGRGTASATSADDLAPGAPVALAVADDEAAGAAQEAVGLTWELSSDPDVAGYRARAHNTVTEEISETDVGLAGSAGFEGLSADIDYIFTVAAYDAAGNVSDPSAAVTLRPADVVAPAAPAGLATADVPDDEGGAFTVSWTANGEPDMLGYTLWRSDPAGAVSIDLAPEVTSHTFSGLAPGETYTVWIEARDTHGNRSAASAAVEGVGCDNVAPPAPAALSAADTPGDDGGSVSLTWEAVPGAATYNLYRDGVLLAAGITGTTYADATALTGTTYSYTLSALDAAGNESAASPAATAASADDLAPPAPAGLAATVDPAGGAIALSWDAVPQAAGYKLFRDGIEIADLAGVTYTDAGLTNGTTYTYTVKSYDAAGNVSEASTPISATPEDAADTTPPSVPADLSATPWTGAVALEWAASSDTRGVTGYEIWMKESIVGEWVKQADNATTSYTRSTLSNGMTYYFKVRAFDAAGNMSGFSSEVTAMPVETFAAWDTERVEDVDARVSWTGTWMLYNSGVYSGGSTTYSNTTGSRCILPFEGTGVTVTSYTRIGSNRGMANIYLDGVYETTVDLYNQTYVSMSVLYETTGLLDGAHVIEIEVAGVKNAAATGFNVDVDCFDITRRTPDTDAPAAPTGVIATDVPDEDGGAVTVSWDPVADADLASYKIYRKPATGSYALVGQVGQLTEFVDTGLVTGATYYYRVTAIDTSGNESGVSMTVTGVALDNRAPVVPQGLAVTDHPLDEGTALDLSWTRNPDLDIALYRVYRSTSLNGTYSLVGSPTDSAWPDSGLTRGQLYFYRISAVDLNGNESARCSAVSAVPVDNVPPPVPAGVTATAPSTGRRVDLTWQASVTATQYRVYRGGILRDTVSGTSYTDFSVTNGTTYSYTVTARDVAGNWSAASTAVSATPADTQAPTAVAGLSALTGDGYANLAWIPSSDGDAVSGYEVWMKEGADGEYAKLADNTTTSYTRSFLVNGTVYYFKVRAFDPSGNLGAFSAECIALPMASTGSPIETRFENTDPALVWTAAWTLYPSEVYSGGSTTYSNVTGARAALTFSGTGVSVTSYTRIGNNRGMANIYLDGVYKTTVDLYNSGYVSMSVLYESAQLTDGQHTLEIEVAGTKNVNATGFNVDVDCIDISRPQ